MKILVATDGSRAGLAALRFGTRLVGQNGAGELTVLTVYASSEADAAGVNGSARREQAEQVLAKVAREVSRRGSPRARSSWFVPRRRRGPEAISRAADRLEADLVVVGSEGRNRDGTAVGDGPPPIYVARKPVTVVRARRRQHAPIRAGGPVAAPVPPNPGPMIVVAVPRAVSERALFSRSRSRRTCDSRGSCSSVARPPRGSTLGNDDVLPLVANLSRGAPGPGAGREELRRDSPRDRETDPIANPKRPPGLQEKPRQSIPATLAAHHEDLVQRAPAEGTQCHDQEKPASRPQSGPPQENLSCENGRNETADQMDDAVEAVVSEPRASRSQCPAGTAEKV